MIKIYDYQTGLLREVMLDPGEKHYLCKLNLKSIKEHNGQKEEKNSRG